MADERLGASFSIDTTSLKTGLAQANRLIRESESEFKSAAAGMDDWSDSQEGLEARIKHLNNAQDLQKKKVEALKKEYKRLVDDGMDETSKAAIEFRTNINKEQEALNKTEKELKKQTQSLKELDKSTKDTDKSTKKLSNSLDGLKSAGKVAVGAIAGIAGACVGAVTAFLALGESTKETQVEMAKLKGAFDSANLSGDAASTALYDLYGVLGDMGRSTEASVLLAKMSKDEDELQANTRILTGVFAEFGDSIPTEGLAEGMQATAEMGSVQGVLADALEWQGVNLDEYNEKLATMSSAEERAAYIQEALTGLYGESADAYRENNKALIESNEAQLQMEQTLADLGSVALPIMTQLKTLTTDLLKAITPFVKLIGEGLTGALNGADEAAEKLADGLSGVIMALVDKIVAMLPFIIQAIISVVPKLVTEILGQVPTILKTLLACVTQIVNALGEMLPLLIPVIIEAVLMIVETLLDNIDQLIDAAMSLIMGFANGLIKAIPIIVEKVPVIIDKLVQALVNNLPKMLETGGTFIIELAKGLIKAIPQLIKSLPQIIISIVNGLKEGIPEMLNVGSELIKGLWEGIKNMGAWIGEKIKGFGESVLNGLKSFFGIASPSKVMADQIGKNLALGIGEGFDENIADVNSGIQKSMEFEGANVNVNSSGGGVLGQKTVNVYQTNNYSQEHSRLEIYKSKQATANAVKLALGGA